VSISQQNIETINAYVDGELAPQEAARVAEEIAADPQLAAMVAKLHAMKSAVSVAFNTQEVIAVAQRKPFFTQSAVRAVAACLLVAVIGGGIWYSVAQRSSNEVVAAAMLQHDNWVAEYQEASSPVIKTSTLVTPDLTPAGLTLAGVQKNVKLGTTNGQRYAYVGRRGCKLSLFVSSEGNAFEGLGNLTRSDALIVKWAVANRSFLLVSRKMNPHRFKTIAKALEAATAREVALDEPMRYALMQSRKPCRDKKIT
jgi:hypothetical protein